MFLILDENNAIQIEGWLDMWEIVSKNYHEKCGHKIQRTINRIWIQISTLAVKRFQKVAMHVNVFFHAVKDTWLNGFTDFHERYFLRSDWITKDSFWSTFESPFDLYYWGQLIESFKDFRDYISFLLNSKSQRFRMCLRSFTWMIHFPFFLTTEQ